MVGQQPVRGGLPLQLGEVRHVPPRQQQGSGARHADQRPPAGEHDVRGHPDAVVGGSVRVLGRGEAHMLAGRLPGAPVGGDDRLALRPAVGQVGVRGAGGLGGADLGAHVGGAQRHDFGVVLALGVAG
jgi:hypothetical protein